MTIAYVHSHHTTYAHAVRNARRLARKLDTVFYVDALREHSFRSYEKTPWAVWTSTEVGHPHMSGKLSIFPTFERKTEVDFSK